MSALPVSATVDLVLFEIGGVRYATELQNVVRIGSTDGEFSVGYPLGRPASGKRALVFTMPGADADHPPEAQLLVDLVLGVHTVSVDDLRRLPLAASTSPVTIGAWVVDGGTQTVLIVDLHATTVSSSSSRGTA